MSDLRTRLIRLAHQNPELRAHLIPILRQATTRKVAYKPLLGPLGLNKDAVMDHRGAMLYFIDKAKNHSKFYEMLIVEEGGAYKLMRRWGALTDSGSTGRVDSADQHFESLGIAQAALKKIYREKTGKGYTDAFGPHHVNMADGKKLPMGTYPVGLTRDVGFGWGTQSVTECKLDLVIAAKAVEHARQVLKTEGHANLVEEDLTKALKAVNEVMVESTMKEKLVDLFSAPLKMLARNMGYVNEQDRDVLTKRLFTIANYITKMTGECGVKR